jgi:hypothetical protein
VLDTAKAFEEQVDDLARRAAGLIGDEADSAGTPFGCGVVERGHLEPLAFWVGVPPVLLVS